MPEVYNWQLGRKATYVYEEKHPKEQFTFVFNTNRCIACQTCTMAHKSTWTFSKGQEYMWWNNVETKPYGGYPQFWDWKILKMLEQSNPGQNVWNVRKTSNKAIHGVYEGVTIFEAPAKIGLNQQAIGYVPTDEEWRFPNFGEDTAHGREFTQSREGTFGGDNGVRSVLPEHKIWFFYLQRICNHCTYPGCLAACPRKAIYKRQEDGIVLIDQSRCRGYKKCVEQCPYKKPMFRGTTRISEKCIACYPRIEGLDPLTEGDQMETRCMAACVGKIRLQGLVKMARQLIGAGMIMVYGSDNGSAGRGFGWCEQLRFENWVSMGFTPHDAIVFATHNGAMALGRDDIGMIEAGRSADFIVLDANPLDDIANTRRIDMVYLRGQKVDRDGMRERWQARWPG